MEEMKVREKAVYLLLRALLLLLVASQSLLLIARCVSCFLIEIMAVVTRSSKF